MTQIRPASCMPDSCFCEAVRETGIRQPANAVSSLAFLAVAIVIIVYATKRATDKTTALLFAITLAFVGFGSALYHATLSFTGQFFDVLGMYLVATLALLLSVNKVRPLSRNTMLSIYAIINTVLGAVLYTAPAFRRWIFALLLVLVVIVEVKAGGHRYRLRQALAIMILAFAIWVTDFTRTFCSPTSFIQGHAIWHILGALAAWFLFLHYQENHVTRIR